MNTIERLTKAIQDILDAPHPSLRDWEICPPKYHEQFAKHVEAYRNARDLLAELSIDDEQKRAYMQRSMRETRKK